MSCMWLNMEKLMMLSSFHARIAQKEVWILLEFTKQAFDKNIYDSYLCVEEQPLVTKVESSYRFGWPLLWLTIKKLILSLKLLFRKWSNVKASKTGKINWLTWWRPHTPMCCIVLVLCILLFCRQRTQNWRRKFCLDFSLVICQPPFQGHYYPNKEKCEGCN